MGISFSRLAIAAVLFAGLASTSRAAITGVRVDHVSSELIELFARDASRTVDGSGLNVTVANSHTVLPDGFMWLNTGTVNCCGGINYVAPLNNIDSSPVIGFDLGAVYNLNSSRVWNYNEAGSLTNRGVATANILISNDNINFTNPFGASQSFTIAPGTNTVDFSQVFNFPVGAQARFVRIEALSNHGSAEGFFGLSEVQFDGTKANSRPQNLITGVTATATSELTSGIFDRAAQHTVDGSGLNTLTGTHSVAPEGNMWLSTGNGIAGGTPDLNPEITFDLGDVHVVGQMNIWNYNEGGGLRARGVASLTVETSLDGVIWSVLDDIDLYAAPGDALQDFHQTFFLNTQAQFIRFSDLTGHGGDNSFIGLSEVQFFSIVPEPASVAIWSLLGLAMVGYGRYRKVRKRQGLRTA